MCCNFFIIFFFFNDTATTEIYTLSLHDALPISASLQQHPVSSSAVRELINQSLSAVGPSTRRSEEHTSELQSRQYLVCRLLLEKKNHTAADPVQVTEQSLILL